MKLLSIAGDQFLIEIESEEEKQEKHIEIPLAIVILQYIQYNKKVLLLPVVPLNDPMLSFATASF